MPRPSLENLGIKIAEKRKGQGLRATAKEVGISSSTLSRVENGHLPDLETFKKICDWLEVNPGDVLGSKSTKNEINEAEVHFKVDKTLEPKTAEALAHMIMYAQKAMKIQDRA
jgi:DNA-binding Xre family transcriptional regulator